MFQRIARAAIVAASALALVAGPASAVTSATKADLSKVEAERQIIDTILAAPPARARVAKPVARAAFADSSGVPINIDSTLPGADLHAVASVLDATYHGSEIGDLAVHVVAMSQIPSICGNPQAVACYLPTDPDNNGNGQIWFAGDDSDWIHSLVHEYGHHMDNQLLNFGHLHRWGIGKNCDFSADGSREWFFSRELEDNIFSSGFSCDPDSTWDHLLGELYAEDFVAMNGINSWELPSARSPTSDQLEAMKWDIDNGLYVKQSRYTRYIKSRRVTWRTVSTPNISFLRVRVSGARGRDFDVFVFKHNSSRLWDKSIRGGRIETYLGWIPPGRWDIGIRAYKKAGTARIQLSLM